MAAIGEVLTTTGCRGEALPVCAALLAKKAPCKERRALPGGVGAGGEEAVGVEGEGEAEGGTNEGAGEGAAVDAEGGTREGDGEGAAAEVGGGEDCGARGGEGEED